jgi:hypothetical protein
MDNYVKPCKTVTRTAPSGLDEAPEPGAPKTPSRRVVENKARASLTLSQNFMTPEN